MSANEAQETIKLGRGAGLEGLTHARTTEVRIGSVPLRDVRAGTVRFEEYGRCDDIVREHQ